MNNTGRIFLAAQDRALLEAAVSVQATIDNQAHFELSQADEHDLCNAMSKIEATRAKLKAIAARNN